MNTYDILRKELVSEGIEIGFEKGREEGREEGVSLKEREFATSLLHSTDFDDAKIALLVGVSIDFVSDLRQNLKK